MRVTSALKEILRALDGVTVPVSLSELEAKVDGCDPATIYRTLKRLKQIGLVRQLNFGERGAKYALASRNEDKDYLICEGCGKVEAMESLSPFHELKKLMQKTGFRSISHELEFYGICSHCD